ncbi:MAG: hypothetical protein NTX82_00730 [Candidatus Parcubacteria bacterium]|nr:hypothetical protein [Candidatus Parcubacteria bacterium]
MKTQIIFLTAIVIYLYIGQVFAAPYLWEVFDQEKTKLGRFLHFQFQTVFWFPELIAVIGLEVLFFVLKWAFLLSLLVLGFAIDRMMNLKKFYAEKIFMTA